MQEIDINKKESVISELYSQFILDSPRISIFLDNEKEMSSPECLFAIILNNYDFSTGLRFLFWCTQTALAPIYKMKLEEINPEKTTNESNNIFIKYHLVDAGKQQIDINDQTLIVKKPFNICKITDDGGTHILENLELFVTVFANNPSYMVEWKNISPPKKKKLKKERWVKVDLVDNENPDETIKFSKDIH